MSSVYVDFEPCPRMHFLDFLSNVHWASLFASMVTPKDEFYDLYIIEIKCIVICRVLHHVLYFRYWLACWATNNLFCMIWLWMERKEHISVETLEILFLTISRSTVVVWTLENLVFHNKHDEEVWLEILYMFCLTRKSAGTAEHTTAHKFLKIY